MNNILLKHNIKFYNNFDLKNFSTLKLQTSAELAIFPLNINQLTFILKEFENFHTIGGGSNILFSSKKIQTPLLFTGKMNEIIFDKNLIEVDCGAKTQMLSKMAAQEGLSGFEFLIGIPSTLGGAVAMNAGAHGQEISDKLISAKIYDKESKKMLELKKDELQFGYRTSIIKQNPDKYCVLSAKFILEKKSKDEISKKMEENIEFRKRNQPNLALLNLGSVFKNPKNAANETISAGMLVDKCGLRGYKSGGACVWDKHCNFVINFNNCTSTDYTNVVYKMYDSVKEKFNIKMTPEIVYVGNMSEIEEEKWKIMRD